eukprot:4469522-Pleurochrysis_carterae.AAC.3
MELQSKPMDWRKAAMPSGRQRGPEKTAVPRTWSTVRTSCGEAVLEPSGKPGGWAGMAGCGGTPAALMRAAGADSRFHRVGSASEGHDAEDSWLVASDEFEGYSRAAGWRRGAVQKVDGVKDRKVPVARWRRGRNQGGSCEFHYGPYSALGHAIHLVHVGRTSRRVHTRVGEEFGESRGQELTRVVRVKRAD